MSSLHGPGSTGRARRLLVAGLLVLAPAACSDGSSTDGASPSADEVATAAAPEDGAVLPDVGDGTYVEVGDAAGREPVTSSCVASTTARSTVLARGEAGTELAVTVFTTDPGPTVEVDLVTDDGRRLTAERVRDVDWEFVGSTIVGATTVSDRSGDSEEVAFAVDFSAGLPECDNQRRLGPGGGETTPEPDPSASGTPDVMTT